MEYYEAWMDKELFFKRGMFGNHVGEKTSLTPRDASFSQDSN